MVDGVLRPALLSGLGCYLGGTYKSGARAPSSPIRSLVVPKPWQPWATSLMREVAEIGEMSTSCLTGGVSRHPVGGEPPISRRGLLR